jgi:hypothetical protein
MPLTTVSPGMLDTTAQYYSFKNRIINGAMVISQRGTSFSTPAAGAYNLDRWLIGWGGAAPATVAQVTGPTGFKNALQVTGAASNTLTQVIQRIESYNCSDLSGATVTLQANIATSSSQTVLWALKYANTQDTFSSVTTISSGTWSATSTATTFSATVSGLPAGAINGLQLEIYPNNAGAFTSGTITITGVQLEKGSTATSFDYRPYGAELALCQRYYEVYYQDTGGVWPTAAYYNGSNFFSYWAFKVEKRAQATVTRVGGTWSGATPTIYNGISSSSFFASVAFYMNATAGTKCLEASAEL